MNLQDCQRLFTGALQPNASNDDFMAACDMLVHDGKMQAEDRLLVYRHNISGGYISALAMTFVVCEQILGKACFSAFARDYAWNNLNQSDDLNQLSEGFPLYLEQEILRRPCFGDYAYIADMARLERLIERSVQAEDSDLSNCVDGSELSNYASESIYPIINKSLFLLETDYPILSLWQKHRDSSNVSNVAGLDERAYLCVCRDEKDDVIIHSVSEEYFKLLTASKSSSLHSLSAFTDIGLVGFLQRAAEKGWIVGFRAS